MRWGPGSPLHLAAPTLPPASSFLPTRFPPPPLARRATERWEGSEANYQLAGDFFAVFLAPAFLAFFAAAVALRASSPAAHSLDVWSSTTASAASFWTDLI